MRAIKEARKFIESNASSADAITLSRLVLALESEIDFPLTDIYLLDYNNFKLALEILQEWRLDRHFTGKSRLYDASLQLAGVTSASAVPSRVTAPAAAGKSAKASAGKPTASGKKATAKKVAPSAKAELKTSTAAKKAGTAKKAAAPKKAGAAKPASATKKAAMPAVPSAASADAGNTTAAATVTPGTDGNATKA